MNVELLKHVADVIVARPSDFDMSDWTQLVEYSCVSNKEESCGTTCCIAGWACTLSRGYAEPSVDWSIGAYTASRVLEIDSSQGAKLYYTHMWPGSFGNAYLDATTDAERAKVAYDRIHHFIQTEGKE